MGPNRPDGPNATPLPKKPSPPEPADAGADFAEEADAKQTEFAKEKDAKDITGGEFEPVP